MKIEKQLLFTDIVNSLLKLQVNDGLSYRQESDGIRAVGPLNIRGVYVNENGEQQSFQEVLEMDVLAPNHKLSKEPFSLEILESKGFPNKDGLQIILMLAIHGLNEDGESVVSQDSVAEDNFFDRIPAPTPTVEEAEDVIDDEVELIANDNEQTNIGEFEDLFEDAGTTYTSYRIVVAKQNDTYDSIAKRYEVDENALRTTNNNKDVLEKTLVILPFQQ